MPLNPRPADVPKIRRTVSVYKVSSIITGTLLLGVALMMVLRYGFGVDIELLGPYGLLALTPKELILGINLSNVLLTIHGWFYVLYLAVDFVLWRYVRWSFGRFLFIALGGIIPGLSFYLEGRVPRDVEAIIASTEPVGVAA